MRNAHERNRRRERAVASLGKCYSFANSQPDAESVADCFVNFVRNTISITAGDICISYWEPSSEFSRQLDAYAEELTRRDAKSHQEAKAVNATYCSGAR